MIFVIDGKHRTSRRRRYKCSDFLLWLLLVFVFIASVKSSSSGSPSSLQQHQSYSRVASAGDGGTATGSMNIAPPRVHRAREGVISRNLWFPEM